MLNGFVLLVILISSLAYIFGGTVILFKKNWTDNSLSGLTALSAGLLLSIAIFDLIPETQETFTHSSVFIMVGFILMYFIQLGSKLHGKKQRKDDTGVYEQGAIAGVSAGMALHNFFEGLSIGMSYSVNFKLGLIVSLALVIHKIPEGLSYSSAMFVSLRKRKKTAIFLVVQVAFIWLGAGCAVLLSDTEVVRETVTAMVLSVVAGIFLYLGGTSLLPLANTKPFRRIPYFFIGGILFYFVFRHIAEALS